ncbi:MAG: response regulator transcription factor [Rhodoferax sp.]|nr:response regulator transcription factor [Rhodoferax sp.]
MHILLIEDDLDLGRALQHSLKAEGLTSEWLRRVQDAPAAFEHGHFDCVLLDLTLPDGSGFDLLTAWRQRDIKVPIVVMTARSGLDDRLAGLDGGADDFVVKPFATPELISRIRAVCRRTARKVSDAWSFGDLCVMPRQHHATRDGVKLDLSPREYRILLELARDPGVVIPKGALAQRLEPLGDPVDFSTLEVHISHLRRKIGTNRITTVRGVGYMFQP